MLKWSKKPRILIGVIYISLWSIQGGNIRKCFIDSFNIMIIFAQGIKFNE